MSREDITKLPKPKRERVAIVWLKTKLEQNRSAARDEHKAECMQKFMITERGYYERVWPKARKDAGLPEKAQRGRKPIN
jgi:hypothetical protein